ncbi:MAG: helix-turn-helix transcriptional regulator [Planctomycetota bacterium]
MPFTENLRYLMKIRGIPAQDLADRLGRSQSVVYGWLRGDHRPARTTLKKLAECFEISPQELLEADLQNLAPPPASESVVGPPRPESAAGPFRVLRRFLHAMRHPESDDVKDFGPVVVLSGHAKQLFDELRSLEGTLEALEVAETEPGAIAGEPFRDTNPLARRLATAASPPPHVDSWEGSCDNQPPA